MLLKWMLCMVPLYDSFDNVRCGWLEGHEYKNLAMQADARFEQVDISVT